MVASGRRKNRDKINTGAPPGKSRIDAGSLPEEPYLVVSLRHLHPNPPVNQTFPDGYATELIQCLARVTRLRHGGLVGKRGSGDHGIDWNKSNVPRSPFEHGLPDQLNNYGGFQISVGKNRGRIIGVLTTRIFYVRWFDPNHETMGRQR